MRSITLAAIQGRYNVRITGPMPIALPAGRSDLPHLCKMIGVRRGAEVGVWKGAFSEEFCKGIPGVEWFAVDPWMPYADYREKKNNATLIAKAYEEAHDRLSPYRCQLVQSHSLEAAVHIADGSLDVVYIDGNHEADFVRKDLEAWSPKVRAGGLMAGHDYRDPPSTKPFIQVKAAVDRYVADAAISPWFIFAGDKTPSFLWVA
jgi:hypothetical protein